MSLMRSDEEWHEDRACSLTVRQQCGAEQNGREPADLRDSGSLLQVFDSVAMRCTPFCPRGFYEDRVGARCSACRPNCAVCLDYDRCIESAGDHPAAVDPVRSWSACSQHLGKVLLFRMFSFLYSVLQRMAAGVDRGR